MLAKYSRQKLPFMLHCDQSIGLHPQVQILDKFYLDNAGDFERQVGTLSASMKDLDKRIITAARTLRPQKRTLE